MGSAFQLASMPFSASITGKDHLGASTPLPNSPFFFFFLNLESNNNKNKIFERVFVGGVKFC